MRTFREMPRITWQLITGVAIFRTKVRHASGIYPQCVDIGDLKDDGSPDLTGSPASDPFEH